MNARRGRVLVAGSINTDLVAWVTRAPAAGETVTGHAFGVYGGGKGANQAFASARSGAMTAMLGAVGRDDFGRQRLSDLDAERIDTEDVATVDGVASGVALIVVEESGQNRIAYVPGATATVTSAQAARACRRFVPGVVLATLELPPAALDALFAQARAEGATVVVNATPEPARGRDLAVGADILVVNETEACELLGAPEGEQDWAVLARRLRQLGPSVVVVTLGAAGAVIEADGVSERLPAPEVEVVDTTGAGDAFCGAFGARLAAGADPLTAARAGVAAGSLAVSRAGAQPSMPRWEEVERLLGGG